MMEYDSSFSQPKEYIPSATTWVAEQVELYESSGGTEGTTLRGMPVIIVTNLGRKTGAIRKTPLMKATDGPNYILIASQGGRPKHPLWYFNLKAHPDAVEIQDGPTLQPFTVREVVQPEERQRLWKIAVAAYPPYDEYQEKTTRKIPVFLAEPRS